MTMEELTTYNEMLSADKSSAKELSPFGLIGGTQKWLAEKYPVNPLTEMKDKFISENPHLTDDINTFFSTTMSTTIKPVIKVHQDFERDKNALLSQIDNLDKQVLALDDDIILDGSNTQFKDTFSKLGKSLAFYKNNMARYDKVMPDLNADLAMQADFANTVLTKLPSQLIGLFDGTEQDYISQLLKGEMTPATYDAALKNYYAKTSGRTSQIVMPRLAGEMTSLYRDSYLPGSNFLKSIQSGNVALFDPELKGTAKQKSYFDDSTNRYFYNGVALNEETKDKEKAKEAAESSIKFMLLPIQDKITEKDNAYKGYNLKNVGEELSYAQNIAEGGLWPWDPGALQFEEDIITKIQTPQEVQVEKVVAKFSPTGGGPAPTDEGIEIKKEKLNKQLGLEKDKAKNLTFDSKLDNPKSAGARGWNKMQIKSINFSLGKGMSLEPIKYSDPKFQEFLKDFKQFQKHNQEFMAIRKELTGGDPAKKLQALLGRVPGRKTEDTKELRKILKTRKHQIDVFKKKWRTETHGTIESMKWLIGNSDILRNIDLTEEQLKSLQ